jgi:hypothetical protein
MVYSCICCLREARNTAEFVAKVLFCHKQGRNTSAGRRTKNELGSATVHRVFVYALSVLCRFAFCALCDLM